jgi:uroporphyrinogen-III synthase
LGNSLAGRGIVVTRPREQADGLAARIQAAGGRVFLFPTLEICEPRDPEPAMRVIDRLDTFDMAVFISPIAVQRAFRLIRTWPPRLRAATVGRGSRAELERHGVAGALAPASGADSESLLAAPQLADVRGKRFVIFRGEGGREVLRETLVSRGALVEYAECYRRARPAADPAPLLAAWSAREVDAVTASSSEGIANLCAMLGDAGAALVQGTPLLVPHPRVAQEARRLGAQTVLLGSAADDETVEQLVAYFNAP